MTTVPELADTAAEAIRAANHITITPHGDMAVPDICTTIAGLARCAHSLDQLVGQLAANASRRVDTGRETGCLRHDAGGDPIDTLIDAIAILDTAAGHTTRTGHALDQAHNRLAHIADTGDLA